MIIKIIAVPDGPAPLEVRKQWLNLELPAKKLPPDALEVDFLKTGPRGITVSDFADRQEAEDYLDAHVPGANKGNRGGFAVDYNAAIKALEKKSPQAAGWFKKNFRGCRGFSFGPLEAKIIRP